MRVIYFASTNINKTQEISKIFSLMTQKIEIRALAFDSYDEAQEPHESYEGNAIEKAYYYGRRSHSYCLADDSGLEIQELGNFPGVRTKEFLASHLNERAAFDDLKERMSHVVDYKARAVCALALYYPQSDSVISVLGYCSGKVVFPPREGHGFSFDKIFIPDGYEDVFSQLDPSIKHAVSHRSNAIRQLLEIENKIIKND